MLLDFGDAVESLGGRYVTAEDVGTGAADMAVIGERTSHVVGMPREHGGGGDPSPLTARGVLAAIGACLERRYGSRSLAGRRVCVVGVGHVGTRLARLLAVGGASLAISDVDPGRRALAGELGADWVGPEEAVSTRCDVLAPCALGGTITRAGISELRCAIVCGSANNVLAEPGLATELDRSGILYAPDFIANAGGLIHVYAELKALPRPEVVRLVEGIGSTLGSVLDEAAAAGEPPLAAARRLAQRRLRGPAVAAA
jgi:leucine dehydrogenase